MKIAYFTKYSRKGASSRLRSYQYFPFLEKQGIEVSVFPLFNDAYLDAIYSYSSPHLQVISCYFRRFINLFRIYQFDKIVIEKELFPYVPPIVEGVLKRIGVKYIVDYDDAIFHNYDLNSNIWIRRLLSGKIDAVMRNSQVVIAGNDYIADRAIKAGAQNVKKIPTVIDRDRYEKKESIENLPIIIGWIGSPTTFNYLLPLTEIFSQLSKKYTIKIYIVGASKRLGVGSIEHHIPWEENNEVNEIKKFDIGIMPLHDGPWEKGKCSYKLIQYMACGIPVVASPVGMNKQVVLQDKNGFLAKDESDWYGYLEAYIISSELRRKHGNVGYNLISEKYNIEAVLPDLIEIIKS